MRRAVVLVTLVMFAVVCLGQDKIMEASQTTNEWCQGSIMLNSGDELTGEVRFDDKNGVVNYKNENESATYTSRSVSAFEFTDRETGTQRVFYTLDYPDPKNNVTSPLFFELLRDFKDFAIISKIDPVDVEDRSGKGLLTPRWGAGDPSGMKTNVHLRQTETVYFLSPDGDIDPYLQTMRKVEDHLLYDVDMDKNKILDKDLIEKYFSKDEYKSMEKFAEDNKLKFKFKQDLVKILDYCLEERNKKKQ